MQHEFKKSKIVGDLGEMALARAYPKQLKRLDGIENDFKIKNSGFLELKTDTYDMARTPNFFMERYSDDHNFKNGGPWYALEKGSNVFLYYFTKNKKLFWFDDVKALVELLEQLTRNVMPIKIPNKGRYVSSYNTLGYKVPRQMLTNLYKEFELGDPLPL